MIYIGSIHSCIVILTISVFSKLGNSKVDTYSARCTSGGVNIGVQLTEYYGSYQNLPFDGVIDEVRISNVGRSGGWIETSYNTAASTDTFLSAGGEETQPPS